MADTAKDKTTQAISLDTVFQKESKSYDLIDSEELEVLYKKKDHLLARLSHIGKENTRLYTRLSSLTKETNNLGNANTVLKSTCLGLKEQISLFARQHRAFNSQSRELKKELKKIQGLKSGKEPDNSFLEKQAQRINLLEKKEQVYTRQIKNLQMAGKQKEGDLYILRKDHEKLIQDLENKMENLYQALSEERNKALSGNPQQIKKINQSLNKKNKELKKEVQKLKEEGRSVKNHESWISQLKKEKETEKSDFVEQLNLFTRERDLLKFQCENLKTALRAGKQGFEQAMLSFQRKYGKLYKDYTQLQKTEKEKEKNIKTLNQKILESENRFISEKEEMGKQIHAEKDKYIGELKGELQAVKDSHQNLSQQIQNLKTKSSTLFLNEKKQMEEEIKDLKWGREQKLLNVEEKYKEEIESLKLDHEKHLKRQEDGFQNQLQHIRVEMENDLCSERKRYEVFKNIKMEEVQELKDSCSSLQKINHEFKTKQFVLEKSLEETKKSLEVYLKDSKRWKEQNESLKSLWQDLQKQNEKKDQQIQSLQKLNSSLSQSLNEKRQRASKEPAGVLKKPSSSLSEEKKDEKELKKSFNHVLADIHFD